MDAKIASDFLCQSDGCHSNPQKICDSRVSSTIYEREVPNCIQVYWPRGLKYRLCSFFIRYTMVISEVSFGVLQP